MWIIAKYKGQNYFQLNNVFRGAKITKLVAVNLAISLIRNEYYLISCQIKNHETTQIWVVIKKIKIL